MLEISEDLRDQVVALIQQGKGYPFPVLDINVVLKKMLKLQPVEQSEDKQEIEKNAK